MKSIVTAISLDVAVLLAATAFAEAASGSVVGGELNPASTSAPGAVIRIAGTTISAATDLQGRFRIALAPEGDIRQVALGHEHTFDNASPLSWRLIFDHAEEDEPDRLDTTFRQDDVEFDPNVSPDAVDPDNILANPLNEDFTVGTLDEFAHEDKFIEENRFFAQVDDEYPYRTSSGTAVLLKGGLKDKDTFRDVEVTIYEEGDYVSTEPVNGGKDYGVVLPQVRLKYRIDDASNPAPRPPAATSGPTSPTSFRIDSTINRIARSNSAMPIWRPPPPGTWT